MAYARHRALFREFQAAARYDLDRFREEAGRAREDAVRLWQAYTTENRQLRGILANLAGDRDVLATDGPWYLAPPSKDQQ
jgi:hypothetical protein